jgi:hypothetical protein
MPNTIEEIGMPSELPAPIMRCCASDETSGMAVFVAKITGGFVLCRVPLSSLPTLGSLPYDAGQCSNTLNISKELIPRLNTAPILTSGARYFSTSSTEALTVFDVDRCIAKSGTCFSQWPSVNFGAPDARGNLVTQAQLETLSLSYALLNTFNITTPITDLSRRADILQDGEPYIGQLDEVPMAYYVMDPSGVLWRAFLDKFYSS